MQNDVARFRAPKNKKSPELLQAEKAGQDLLYAFFRSRPGCQAEVARHTKIDPPSLSRMSHGASAITLESAIAIDVATDGKLPAQKLCPAAAEWIDRFIARHINPTL